MSDNDFISLDGEYEICLENKANFIYTPQHKELLFRNCLDSISKEQFEIFWSQALAETKLIDKYVKEQENILKKTGNKIILKEILCGVLVGLLIVIPIILYCTALF